MVFEVGSGQALVNAPRRERGRGGQRDRPTPPPAANQESMSRRNVSGRKSSATTSVIAAITIGYHRP